MVSTALTAALLLLGENIIVVSKTKRKGYLFLRLNQVQIYCPLDFDPLFDSIIDLLPTTLVATPATFNCLDMTSLVVE